MATLTVQDIKGPFDSYATAGSATFTFAAGTVAGDLIPCTGREVILAKSGGSYTLTITSIDDETGRAKNITAYALGSGEYAAFGVGLTNSKGWKNATNQIAVAVSNTGVLWAVLKLPVGYGR